MIVIDNNICQVDFLFFLAEGQWSCGVSNYLSAG